VTIRRLALVSESGLVPVADRLRYMRLFRLLLVATVVGYWWVQPAARALPAPTLAAVTAAYLALSALGGRAWRLRRDRAISLFSVTLLADGVYLAIVAYTPRDSLPPLRYLVLMHVIAVTLLASFRTGLKVTVWHTLLIWLDIQLRASGAYGPAPAPGQETARVVAFTAILWLVAYCTASFAALNERELRRRGYDLEALARLGLSLERASRASAVAVLLVEAIAADFGVPRVALVHVTPTGAVVLAGHGLAVAAHPDRAPEPGIASPDHDGLVTAALADRATLLVSHADPARDPWLASAFPAARNLALVPMQADEQTLGVLCVEYGLRRGSRIEQRVVSTIERFVSHGSLALQNALLLEQISQQATTDGLTGAANRRTLELRLAREAARAGPDGAALSLLMLDVDHFKKVNDEHGHLVGDNVLRHLVTVTGALCRPQDLLARYGGEEFALLLPRTDATAAWTIAERVRTQLIASDPPVPITISVGLATLPADGTTVPALVHAADSALYRAKRAGRNRTVRSGRPDGGESGDAAPGAPDGTTDLLPEAAR